MKANKALKRLAKIEVLLSDLTVRYATDAPVFQEALQEAKAAVARAKEATTLDASSGKAKPPKPPSKASTKKTKPQKAKSVKGR
jgi:hypothetical protein